MLEAGCVWGVGGMYGKAGEQGVRWGAWVDCHSLGHAAGWCGGVGDGRGGVGDGRARGGVGDASAARGPSTLTAACPAPEWM